MWKVYEERETRYDNADSELFLYFKKNQVHVLTKSPSFWKCMGRLHTSGNKTYQIIKV